jgi:hypothetical protein
VIASGLVIQEPWIDLIEQGLKTWEMRKTATKKRGWIGLIRKGTGFVTGAARLIDSLPALSPEDHALHFNRHRVPAEPNGRIYWGEYLHPWVLQAAFHLPRLVPYEHKSGAVIWVRFSDKVRRKIWDQIILAYPSEAIE